MSVGGSHSVSDKFDVPLEDPELLDEVELTTNLIIAATSADHELSQGEIDALLGVENSDS